MCSHTGKYVLWKRKLHTLHINIFAVLFCKCMFLYLSFCWVFRSSWRIPLVIWVGLLILAVSLCSSGLLTGASCQNGSSWIAPSTYSCWLPTCSPCWSLLSAVGRGKTDFDCAKVTVGVMSRWARIIQGLKLCQFLLYGTTGIGSVSVWCHSLLFFK